MPQREDWEIDMDDAIKKEEWRPTGPNRPIKVVPAERPLTTFRGQTLTFRGQTFQLFELFGDRTFRGQTFFRGQTNFFSFFRGQTN
jgi:hypothetical protein